MDIKKIEQNYLNMRDMSCKPCFKKMPTNTVIDEDKSVRWNQEQVMKNRKAYEDEVARLNTLKNKARDQVYADLVTYMDERLNGLLNEETMKILSERLIAGEGLSGFTKIEEIINILAISAPKKRR